MANLFPPCIETGLGSRYIEPIEYINMIREMGSYISHTHPLADDLAIIFDNQHLIVNYESLARLISENSKIKFTKAKDKQKFREQIASFGKSLRESNGELRNLTDKEIKGLASIRQKYHNSPMITGSIDDTLEAATYRKLCGNNL